MGYKVVCRANASAFPNRQEPPLISAVVVDDATVEYIPHKWAYPPSYLRDLGYGLLFFMEYDLAYSWFSKYDRTIQDYQLWRCHARHITRTELLPPILSLSYIEKKEVALRYVDRSIDYRIEQLARPAQFWPKGTCMAERIKLVRRVL